MPVDPTTGQRLPYAGDPGAPAGAPPAPGAAPAEIVPERDIVPLAEEADRLMLDEALGTVEGALGPAETLPADVPEEEEGQESAEVDVTPIAEALGVDQENAQALYDAAQQMPRLAGKSPEEIGQMLSDDIDLRMQVEQIAARTSDLAAEDEDLEPVGEVAPEATEGDATTEEVA